MKKILVALDSSPVSVPVLDEAVKLAKYTGGQLILYRAVTLPAELPREFLLHPEEELSNMLKVRAELGLKDLAALVPKELIAAIRTEFGTPWQAICDEAKRENVDVIVLGAHGYKLIDRLLGTTAARVVNHADRTVMVVRPRDAAAPTG